MLIAPISLIFCGHLGDPVKLDGAALGISVSEMSVNGAVLTEYSRPLGLSYIYGLN